MRLGIMGPGRSGKDDAAELLVNEFGLRYAGSTSVVISRRIAERDGISFEEAHAQRHERRQEWYEEGNRMREKDPVALVRGLLPDTDLVVGVRSRGEVAGMIEERMVDLMLWIDRPGTPKDPTLEFGPEVADIVIYNHWDLEAYRNRIRALARAIGLEKK